MRENFSGVSRKLRFGFDVKMATDWEDHYRRRETPWDKGAPSPGLLDFLQHHPITGQVLVPGCGFGHDVRALAQAGAEVLGVDLAPSAVAGAQAIPAVAGERYEVADLFALGAHLRGRFDWVWEHTCFCAIDPGQRVNYVESVAEALKPGGHFLAVFYLDPGMDNPADGPPFGCDRAELDALFGTRFTLEREWAPERAYPGREGREWMRLLVKKPY